MWSRMSAGDTNADGILSETEFMNFLPAAPEAPAEPPGRVPAGHPSRGSGGATAPPAHEAHVPSADERPED